MVKYVSVDSPEWNDYFLSELSDAEKEVDSKGNIYPKVAGLRRLVNKLVGKIIKSGITHIYPVTDEKSCRATIVYEVCVKTNDDYITYSDAADCWLGNCNPPYNNHPVAIATTRAEARSLRKLARIRNVSAEEMDLIPPPQIDSIPLISSQQIQFLNDKCKEKNINVVKFLAEHVRYMKDSKDENTTNLQSVTKDNASKILQQINKYLNGTEVPKNLSGYKEWSI